MNEKILSFIENRQLTSLRAELEQCEPADIAALLTELPERALLLAYRVMPKELAAEVFVQMDADAQKTLINAFSDKELKDVLAELFLDDTVDIIEEMPANVVKRIIRNSDPEMRKSINEVLQYPADSAGSMMTNEYVDLKKNMTVAEAFDHIRHDALDKETVYTCYVIDPNRHLEGLVTVKTLLLSDKSAIIGDIMEKNVIYADTHEDQESVAHKFDRYDFLALPVVDQEKRLVGIITVDDAMDVLQEENTEDFAKMAAMEPIQDSYLRTSVLQHAKKRIVWLLILMLSGTVTGLIIAHYEDAFAAIPMLVAFIPMLMDTGGNSGAQSSTMIIRGLALEEFTPRDFWKVYFKEIRIALIVGVILASVNAARIVLMYGSWPMALITAIALVITVILSKSLGCILPMLAKKLKLDPAIMASPLLTTIVDACSVVVYFAVATRVLGL